MGFFRNMIDEAGSKTGKAIGNKLFGKYGADQTINVNTGNNTGGQGGFVGLATTLIESSKKSDELQLKEYEDKEAIKKELREVEFDIVNIQNNYTILLKLIPLIESEMKFCYLHEGEIVDEEGLYELAISKFNTWVTMLQIQDLGNPNIIVFQNKQKEWNDYWQSKIDKEKRKNRIFWYIILAFFIGLPLLIIILGNIFWWW
ncbi:MAG: hypothetical protein IJB08_04615 [Alistipes sp.]|nr:hypothetical protein [Alistipes sp.]MBQ3247306.1 hypothetical protein [Alistipes sp.]